MMHNFPSEPDLRMCARRYGHVLRESVSHGAAHSAHAFFSIIAKIKVAGGTQKMLYFVIPIPLLKSPAVVL